VGSDVLEETLDEGNGDEGDFGSDDSDDSGEDKKAGRLNTFAEARHKLTFLERMNIAFIRRTFEWRWLDNLMLWFQRVPGVFWVHNCTRHIRLEVGLERLGPIGTKQGMILVSNHRSFFDMFVINMVLYRAGFNQRLLFPVRSNFFYDSPIGWFVNGIMSWFSMYPPIFRDRKRAVLNHTSLSELTHSMRAGRSAGIHPEGRRNQSADPYTLLPAQAGTGRLIHLSRVPVVPIFINGLGNDLVKQVWGNFNKKGKTVIVVYGAPIDFGSLLDQPANAKTFRAIAEKTREAIMALGQEERAIRAKLPPRGAQAALAEGSDG